MRSDGSYQTSLGSFNNNENTESISGVYQPFLMMVIQK